MSLICPSQHIYTYIILKTACYTSWNRIRGVKLHIILCYDKWLNASSDNRTMSRKNYSFAKLLVLHYCWISHFTKHVHEAWDCHSENTNLPGLANWQTEKFLRSTRFTNEEALFIWSSVARGTAVLVSVWSWKVTIKLLMIKFPSRNSVIQGKYYYLFYRSDIIGIWEIYNMHSRWLNLTTGTNYLFLQFDNKKWNCNNQA